MTAYLITYDLNRPGQKYDDLYEAIDTVSDQWIHYLDSVWMVTSSKSAGQIATILKPHMDSGDNLFVVAISGAENQGWLPQKAWDWIRQYVD